MTKLILGGCPFGCTGILDTTVTTGSATISCRGVDHSVSVWAPTLEKVVRRWNRQSRRARGGKDGR